MKIHPLRLLLPQLEKIASLSEVCLKAKDEFRNYADQGWFLETADAGIYIYKIEQKGRSHTGILALNDVSDYKNGKIKKHEKTLATREAEYHLLLREWKAILKPVLMTYPANTTVSGWINNFIAENNPEFEAGFPEEEEKHYLWAIRNETQMKALQSIFADAVPSVYIADGHHRTSTISNFSDRPEIAAEGLDFSRIFCAYFADDQLDILGYHRVLKLDEGSSVDQFIERLTASFAMTALPEIRLPQHKREMVVVSGHGAWSLDFSTIELPMSPVLDATILNDRILGSIAGILEVRSNKRVVYPEGGKGINGVMALVAEAPESRIGFLLYPVSFSDLFYISDQGESLPPKSTWFEPRIKSGLTVQNLAITVDSQ